MRKFGAKTLVVVGIIHTAVICQGEGLPPEPLPCSKWVRFEIVLGRVTASRPRCRKNQRFTVEKPDVGVQEVLTFASQGEIPSIQWRRTEPTGTFSLMLESGNIVSLESAQHLAGKETTLHYRQPKIGPVVFTVKTAGQTTTYQADSLWHLFLLSPAMSAEHLIPLIERLRPHWHLDTQAQRLAAELQTLADNDWRPDHQQMAKWVEDLASDQFQKRNQADSALRACGFAALSHLRAYKASQLSPEQQERLQKIQQGLRLEAGDTPFRMARWLSEDKHIWLSLLAHGEASVRQTAALRLSKLCQRPIDFDPHAPGSERRLQIERLSPLLATDSQNSR
ncbi:MAG: hypothetical protein CL681_18070 [Blastopirellula sp.]|nr:hypothetical protein [Blastopirellula sp.]